MTWNAVSPNGTISVKSNTTPMQQNTTYTEMTLNVDHYWNIGTDEDGHHLQVQMVKKDSDLTLDTGMDGGMYLKETTDRVEGFYRNDEGIYQFIPSFLEGTKTLSTSNQDIVAVPNNTYGWIFMFKIEVSGGAGDNGQSGFFKAAQNVCQTYGHLMQKSGSSSGTYNVKFQNFSGGGGNLNIRGASVQGGTGEYQYRVVYWGI